ncbi:hypothetical protein L211DRAFT_197828 [Terfezia boudieri ATCC MYA-4762]|uniref:DUF4219 domain-containing protein n=1 Tax=Terfezia boudieri ATCC MYA-4762 TaxID=1051890 RepID=A0A3N4LM10_9PEZI|nr:hypothetical protein L211DRAFT_197828 [Terfezia boudieri ATCC MYA-4762]
MADLTFAALRPSPPKLVGASNYRTWAKDMEMILLRVPGAWKVTTEDPPEEEELTPDWHQKNDFARSEIHLACSPERQELIIDSETAYESWKILKDKYSRRNEIVTQRLKKEFASAKMTEEDVSEYIEVTGDWGKPPAPLWCF